MSWVVLAASLAAVVALAMIARLLGLGGGDGLGDDAAARLEAEHALHDFVAVASAVDAGGHSALVAGADGSVALVRRHGAQVAVRRLTPPVAARVDGDRLIVPTGEAMFGAGVLDLGAATARAWAARLEGPGDARPA